MEEPSNISPTEGKAYPWILEHLLAYPGTYEIPLRTMYTLNVTTQNGHQNAISQPAIPVNAFSRPQRSSRDEQQAMTTATAAAQLRANLMSHISQQPSQPTSLPPSFITSFVRQTFGEDLSTCDFMQALTAMDYLRDLDIRRRREVLAALDKLGVDRNDLGHKDKLAKKYPGVVRWILEIELKERKVETVYSNIYVGLRRWTLLNEMSLNPFNKANCIAMLNTLYPPPIPYSAQGASPTAQLTPQILSTQRNGFFRYITAVEREGTGILKSLFDQNKKPGDENGWANLHDSLDSYLRMATGIIDECHDITGQSNKNSPTTTSFGSVVEFDEDGRRKKDSGISFSTSCSSNRNSAGSHANRPSTSSSFSTHSRQASNQKQLPEKPLPAPVEEDDDATPVKPAGTKLERIARELRKIRSRSIMREQSRPRPRTAAPVEDTPMPDVPQTPSKDRTLGFRKSLKKMRSSGVLRERDGNSRPSTSGSEPSSPLKKVPNFDVEEMKRRRQEWEQKSRQNSADLLDLN
jgi:hypothetical protein